MFPRGRRIPSDRDIDLIDGAITIASTLLDVSAGGLRVEMKLNHAVSPGTDIVVSNGLRSVPGKVRWCCGTEAGIAFSERVSPRDMAALTGVSPGGGGGWSPY